MSVTTTTTTKNRVKWHKGHSVKYAPPTPYPPAGRQIMVPIGIMTYQSLPDSQFPTTMSLMTMTINKRLKLNKVHSTNARSYVQEADNSAHRYYERPIHSQKLIPENYERDNDDE